MVPEDRRDERVGGVETTDPLSALNEECVRTVQYFRGFAVNFSVDCTEVSFHV
jgi:hypothetical protein